MARTVFRVNPVKLDREMTEQKVSAEALGRASGHTDGSYIRRMRKGEKRAQSATRQTAEAISRMLGLPIDYLFTEINASTGTPVALLSDSKTVAREQVPA